MTIGPVEAVKLKYHTRNTNKMRWVAKYIPTHNEKYTHTCLLNNF